MASVVPNNWKAQLGISVSELCFKNALGLLINEGSNFQEERIIARCSFIVHASYTGISIYLTF